MADQDVGIVITGDSSQLNAALSQSASSIQTFGQNAGASLNGLQSVVNGLTGSTQSMAQHFAQLNASAGRDAFNNLAAGLGASMGAIQSNNAAMDAANQKLAALRPRFDELADGARKSGDSMHALSLIGSQIGAAITLNFAVNKVLEFRAAIQEAQVTIDKLRNTIGYGMGAASVGQELDYLRRQTQAMGLEFTSTSTLYAKFAAAAHGTAMEGKGVKDVFESIGKAATVMGLSANDVQGVMLALTQIMSKGTVQSEEIRGQLGERLPGAFQIASRAMGATTAEFGKLLETGQVMSTDFLPKFAAQMEKELGGSFEKAATSAQASMNRLTSAWELFKIAMADDVGLGKTIASMNDRLSATLGTWTTNIRAMSQSSGLREMFTSATFDAQGLEQEISIASTELARLDGILSKAPSNVYAKSAAADMADYLRVLQAVKEKFDAISGKITNPYANEDARLAAMTATKRAEDERRSKVASGFSAVQLDLSGQNANFQKHLAALKAGYDDGLYGPDATKAQAKYVADVQALIKKEGMAHQQGADHLKTIHDAKYALLRATEEKTTAVLTASIAEQQRVNDLSYKGGSVDMETYYAKKAALETDAINRKQAMLESELSEANTQAAGLKKEEDKLRARERIVKLETQLILLGVERAKIDGPADQAVRAWQRLNAAVSESDRLQQAANNQLYSQQKALTESNEEAKIKLQYQFDIAGSLKEELALLDLKTERQRKILEQKLAESTLADEEKNKLRALLEEDAALKAQQAQGNYVMGILNSVDQTARSVWTNVLQGGQDAFTKIGNTIKSAILDLLYQMTIKKWIINIGASLTGSAGSAAGSSLIGSAGSSFLSSMGMSSMGSIAASGFTTASNAYLVTSATGSASAGSAAALAAAEAGGATSAGAGLAASAGSTIAAAMPYIAAAVIAYSVLKGDATKPSIEGGYSTAGDPGTNGRAYVNGYYGGALDAASKKVVEGMGATYANYVKAAGGKAGSFTASQFTGIDQNGHASAIDMSAFVNGKAVYNRYTDLGTNKVGSSDAEIQAAIELASKKALLSALAVTDMGPLLNEYLSSVTVAGKAIEDINASLSNVTDLTNFASAMRSMPFAELASASAAAVLQLSKVSGGMDSFVGLMGNYYNLFTTDAQKQADTLRATQAGFADIGITLAPITESLRDWYRSEVARLGAMNLSIEANASAYASALKLANGVDTLAKAQEQAAATQKSWQDQLDVLTGKTTESDLQLQRDLASTTDASTQAIIRQVYAQKSQASAAAAAETARTQAINDAKAALDRATSAERNRIQSMVDVAQESVSQLSSLFDLLKTNVAELYGQVSSTAAMSATQANQFIAQALATANGTGYLPAQDQLQSAITAARAGLGSSIYASQFEADRAKLVLAGQLDALKSKTGSQLSFAEQQLSAAKAQLTALESLVKQSQNMIDAANGIDTSIQNLGAAFDNLAKLLSPSAASKTTLKTGAHLGSGGDAFVIGGTAVSGTVDNPVQTVGNDAYGGISYDAYVAQSQALFAGLGGNGKSATAAIEALTEEVRALRAAQDTGNEYAANTAAALNGQQPIPLLVQTV